MAWRSKPPNQTLRIGPGSELRLGEGPINPQFFFRSFFFVLAGVRLAAPSKHLEISEYF